MISVGRVDLGDELDIGEDIQPGGPACPRRIHDPHTCGQGAVQYDACQTRHLGA